jgi:hypothetical protein
VRDEKIWRVDCVDRIKPPFAIFQMADFLKCFQIGNEQVFRVLKEIRDMGKPIPSHNWHHALDVVEFITYKVLASGFDHLINMFTLCPVLVCSCREGRQ